jgi:hypothetical protein
MHRLGAENDLYDDFTIIFMSARGYNNIGSQDKLRRFLQLAMKHNAVNFGNMEAGNSLFNDPAAIIEAVKDGTTVQATFASETDLFNIVDDLVKEDLGMSVVVQGLLHKVEECCAHAGLKPHTWNNSLGVWGKKELLPSEDIMQFTTMCGHGMVAVGLVEKVIERVKKGKISCAQGAMELARPCICGFVNVPRAERLLRRLTEKE